MTQRCCTYRINDLCVASILASEPKSKKVSRRIFPCLFVGGLLCELRLLFRTTCWFCAARVQTHTLNLRRVRGTQAESNMQSGATRVITRALEVFYTCCSRLPKQQAGFSFVKNKQKKIIWAFFPPFITLICCFHNHF